MGETVRFTKVYRAWQLGNVFPPVPADVNDIQAETIHIAGQDVWCVTAQTRDTFLRLVSSIGSRCRPRALPQAVGAMTIFGVRDWAVIDRERRRFSGTEEEWRGYLSEYLKTEASEKWKAPVVILSRGRYSNVPAEDTPYPEAEWQRLSLEIRKYHEMAHIFSRRCFPSHREALRDEVLADAVGLIHAIGDYDPVLAARFLGIREGELLPEGRLYHYLKEDAPSEAMVRVCAMIQSVASFRASHPAYGPFEFLNAAEADNVAF